MQMLGPGRLLSQQGFARLKSFGVEWLALPHLINNVNETTL